MYSKMKLLVAFLSTCALALGVALPRFDDKIIGGEETTIENYPYTVSFRYYDAHICGGSIVNENTILTSCQCVDTLPTRSLSIRVGSTGRDDGDKYEIASVTQHPDYSINGKNNNVAVVKLARPLTFSTSVQPIALQPANTPVPEGTTASISGWGTMIPEWPAYVRELRDANVDVISHAQCESMFAGTSEITDKMMCTLTAGLDFCSGDTGGPLAADGRLIGIMSGGHDCAVPNFPSVYADVSALRDFIDQYLN